MKDCTVEKRIPASAQLEQVSPICSTAGTEIRTA
jgi:hypothetical protein